MPRTLAVVSLFLLDRAYSTSSLSSLDLYSDYVGVNISLNNSSSLSFLNMYAPPIRSSSTDGRTDFFSPSRNLFILGNFNCHHHLWDSKGTSDPCREEVFDWVISSPTTALTHLHFYIAPLLISPLLPSLLPFLAPGRCFRTWVLTPYQFFYMSLSLSGLSPQRAYPFLRFSESSLEWLCFPLSFCRGILVSFLCCCSLYLSGTECGQMFHSFRLHQTPF